MDPQQRLLLEYAQLAFVDAGYTREALQGRKVGVFVGIAGTDAIQIASRAVRGKKPSVYAGSGLSNAMAAGRLSYVFGLNGPCTAYDTACSSSLVALHAATRSLQNHECDLALVAGVNVMLTPESSLGQAITGLTSATGRCHTFDASADGYVRSEGCGALVLERQSEALKRPNSVYSIVQGASVAQDGTSASLTAPNGRAQEGLLQAALDDAKSLSSEVDYLESFGTGSLFGDLIEMRAASSVFESKSKGELVVGGVKANIGHTEAAAGIAGLIKAVLVLQTEQAPANAELKELNPKIAEVLKDSQFKFPVAMESLRKASGKGLNQALVAGVSSFGFSGTIAHVVMSQPDNNLAKRRLDLSRTVEPCFKRQAYPWQEPRHPLLQDSILIGDRGVEFRAVLHPFLLTKLHEQVLNGRRVFPESGFVEMAIASRLREASLPHGHWVIEMGDVTFVNLLELNRENLWLACELTTKSGAMELRAHSLEKSKALMCTISHSTTRAMEDKELLLDLSDAQSRCSEIVHDTLACYSQVWRSQAGDELLASLPWPEYSEQFHVHPGLMDAMFRLVDLVATAPWGASWVVQHFESMELTVRNEDSVSVSRRIADTLLAHVQVVEMHDNEVIVNMALFARNEELVDKNFLQLEEVKFVSSSMYEKAPIQNLHPALDIAANLPMSIQQLRASILELASMHASGSLPEVSGTESLQDLGLSSLAIIGLRNSLLDQHGVFLGNDFVLSGTTLDELASFVHTALLSKRDQGGAPDLRGLDSSSEHEALPHGFVVLNKLAREALSKAQHELPNPLFLIHDVTGQIRHLETVADLLPNFACFGVRYDANVVNGAECTHESVFDLGITYAQQILSMPGLQTRTKIRIGGYSYGCRVAYAAAEFLENQGLEVEVVLLDGPIDGPIHRDVREIIKFSLELYQHANMLERAFDDEVVDIFETMNANLVGLSAEDRIRLERTIGHAHLEPLLRHVEIVIRLATLTQSYRASYRLRGRALRITSESTTEPDAQASALIANLTEATARGGHFEFFRMDAPNVAATINKFLTFDTPSASAESDSASDQSDRQEVWFSTPDAGSEGGLKGGIRNILRMEWDHAVVTDGVDLPACLLVSELTISCAPRSDKLPNPLSGPVTIVWENVQPPAGARVGTWLNAQLARIPDDADFLCYDKGLSELSFRVDLFVEFPLPPTASKEV